MTYFTERYISNNDNRSISRTCEVHLRLFFIELKFPRGQKIPPGFRIEQGQSRHWKNRAEKGKRKNALRIFNFLSGFSQKKFINQSNLSKMYTNILKNGSRQRENSFSSTQ